MFQALLRVFQGSVSESLLLHATHCSYPSRRRACLECIKIPASPNILFADVVIVVKLQL